MFHQLPKKYYRLLNHLYMCHKKGVTFIYSNKHPIFKNDAHTMDLCDWLRDNDYIKYVNSYNQKRNELYSDTHLIITPSGITYVENHKFQLIQCSRLYFFHSHAYLYMLLETYIKNLRYIANAMIATHISPKTTTARTISLLFSFAVCILTIISISSL